LDDLTEDQREELLHGYTEASLALVLSLAPGEYVIFPNGIRKFAADHSGEAVFIDEDQHVYVLRSGLTKDKMKWVQLTLENDAK
jgi:hypothetical protein